MEVYAGSEESNGGGTKHYTLYRDEIVDHGWLDIVNGAQLPVVVEPSDASFEGFFELVDPDFLEGDWKAGNLVGGIFLEAVEYTSKVFVWYCEKLWEIYVGLNHVIFLLISPLYKGFEGWTLLVFFIDSLNKIMTEVIILREGCKGVGVLELLLNK